MRACVSPKAKDPQRTPGSEKRKFSITEKFSTRSGMGSSQTGNYSSKPKPKDPQGSSQFLVLVARLPSWNRQKEGIYGTGHLRAS
jgi:hypothetical protein